MPKRAARVRRIADALVLAVARGVAPAVAAEPGAGAVRLRVACEAELRARGSREAIVAAAIAAVGTIVVIGAAMAAAVFGRANVQLGAVVTSVAVVALAVATIRRILVVGGAMAAAVRDCIAHLRTRRLLGEGLMTFWRTPRVHLLPVIGFVDAGAAPGALARWANAAVVQVATAAALACFRVAVRVA